MANNYREEPIPCQIKGHKLDRCSDVIVSTTSDYSSSTVEWRGYRLGRKVIETVRGVKRLRINIIIKEVPHILSIIYTTTQQEGTY